MIKESKVSFFIRFFTVLILALIISGCAAMKSPEGGPRDTTPPKVLKITPKNLTTNFKDKKIVIQFDEYIKLRNEFKEFSISPELDRIPTLKVKQKNLEISLTDTLETNTTYTLNFGKSIVDLNEGNELKNFTYVLATGPTLDSLSISGRVINALTGLPEIETTVFILPLARDSLFGKKKAAIFTLTDSSGNFQLNNLKKDTYKIYALKELNGDRIYQQANDEIAFLKDSIVVDKNFSDIKLSIFKELAPAFRVRDRRFNADGSLFMNFTQQLPNLNVKVIEPANLDPSKLIKFNTTKDSLTVWLTDLSFDSTKLVLSDNGRVLDTVKFTRGKRDTYTRNINVSENLEGGVLAPQKNLTISFNLPIQTIDQTKIILLEDSIPKTFVLATDSINPLQYHIKYKWRPKERYELVLKENAVTAIFETKNKEIRKLFTIGDANDYGALTLSIQTPELSKAYILEIVDKEKNVLTQYQIRRDTTVRLTNYKQGVYYGRIVYDLNKNGLWDTGSVKSGRQPETIWYEPKELSIRANWDREETIKIPLVPYPLEEVKPASAEKIQLVVPEKDFKKK